MNAIAEWVPTTPQRVHARSTSFERNDWLSVIVRTNVIRRRPAFRAGRRTTLSVMMTSFSTRKDRERSTIFKPSPRALSETRYEARDSLELARMLLDYGADVNARETK